MLFCLLISRLRKGPFQSNNCSRIYGGGSWRVQRDKRIEHGSQKMTTTKGFQTDEFWKPLSPLKPPNDTTSTETLWNMLMIKRAIARQISFQYKASLYVEPQKEPSRTTGETPKTHTGDSAVMAQLLLAQVGSAVQWDWRGGKRGGHIGRGAL